MLQDFLISSWTVSRLVGLCEPRAWFWHLYPVFVSNLQPTGTGLGLHNWSILESRVPATLTRVQFLISFAVVESFNHLATGISPFICFTQSVAISQKIHHRWCLVMVRTNLSSVCYFGDFHTTLIQSGRKVLDGKSLGSNLLIFLRLFWLLLLNCVLVIFVVTVP